MGRSLGGSVYRRGKATSATEPRSGTAAVQLDRPPATQLFADVAASPLDRRSAPCRSSHALPTAIACHNMIFVLLTGIVVAAIGTISGDPIPECCTLVTGSCKSACEQISLVAIATSPKERKSRLDKIELYCPKELVSLWECMNGTLKEIQKGEGWSGRQCCILPQSRSCRHACLTAQSKDDLLQKCRLSDEINFFTCVDKQEAGDKCCSRAETAECHQACQNVFKSRQAPTYLTRNAVTKACSNHSPEVDQCVRAHAVIKPAKNPERFEHCCDKSNNISCKNSCIQALRSRNTEHEIVDLVGAACGLPLPDNGLWQCFLQNADVIKSNNPLSSEIQRMGMDSAKLHCCFKAVTLTCQKLCFRKFSNDWTNSWDKFNQQCQNQMESEMMLCLLEVDEPCELGCEGLSYCTNFNNRPTEMFQSCNEKADLAAQKDVELWQQGHIQIPYHMIPMVDISGCPTNLLKSIACALHIKPCHRNIRPHSICRSDCLDILTSCADFSQSPSGHTPESICDFLSPPESSPICIYLAPYLVESSHASNSHQVTHPCKPNPCGSKEICIINRNCPVGQPCAPYNCIPGCKVGNVSNLKVPQGTLVRIATTSTNAECTKICQCSERSVVEECLVIPCLQQEVCWLGETKIEHKKVFDDECNKCICFNGDINCVRKSCSSIKGQENIAFTGLPCDCPAHYVPVCGATGKTYPSDCLARCVGLQGNQVDFGFCSSLDPCSNNPCNPNNQRCVPRRRICLSIKNQRCKQYECVDVVTPCEQQPVKVVCDTRYRQYPNMCSLLRNNATLAFRGPCLSNCQRQGTVCGHNGETYNSECAAWADHITVDYEGPCMAVGPMIGDNNTERCPTVKCPPLANPNCMRVTPPGACCPICGGGIQVMINKFQMDKLLEIVPILWPITTETIVESFQHLLQVAECDLFAYLSIDNTLVLLVVPIVPQPTTLQIMACVAESEKLSVLIERGSPVLVANAVLSNLVKATVLHTPHLTITSAQTKLVFAPFHLMIPLLLFMLLMKQFN